MLKAPRFHSLSASTAFDLATPLTDDWSPDNNANAGRVDALQETVGRISFLKQLRAGSIGAVVLARSLVDTGVMQVRSATTTEYTEAKPSLGNVPVANDVLIQNVALATTWSTPIILSPTDALCFGTSHLPGTVEWQMYDLQEETGVAWIEGILAANSGDACCTSDSADISASVVLTAWATNTRYFFINATAGSSVTYPALADLEVNQKAVFVRVGGGVVFLAPAAGELQNGLADGIVELDGRVAVIVTRRETTWSASKQLLSTGQTIEIAVANSTVDITAAVAPQEAARIEATARGFARLPALASSAVGDIIPIPRNGGTGQIIIIPQTGETLNGEVNGQYFLGLNNNALAVKTPFGWLVVGDNGGRPTQSLTLAVDSTLDAFGEDIIVLATQAGAQTITLPPTATNTIKVGARARIGCAGAGGLTIAGGGATIRSGTGAPAASMPLAQHENADLVWSGDFWFAILGT